MAFSARGEPDAKRAASAGGRSTSICPWSLRAMPNTAASPRPRPANLVLKNGIEDLGARGIIHAASDIAHLDADAAAGGGVCDSIERAPFELRDDMYGAGSVADGAEENGLLRQ
ncbi:MAG TPA: hypothetical protein VNH18_30930 [Bryobacteraceae bacterium]|nr:hypothetical protein [Bryobacteraceae bacterium]HXJ43739.1 hypothetical protein [Bryobacteraceae bacterium]